MKNYLGTSLIRKQWRVMSSDDSFTHEFARKTCQGNHTHATIEGSETNRTSYYPAAMVRSIAHFWLRKKHQAQEKVLAKLEWHESDQDLLAVTTSDQPGVKDSAEHQAQKVAEAKEAAVKPTDKEIQIFDHYLHKIHLASGNATSKNMARMLKDAGKLPWMIEMALLHRCDICEQQRPGGQLIPQASS